MGFSDKFKKFGKAGVLIGALAGVGGAMFGGSGQDNDPNIDQLSYGGANITIAYIGQADNLADASKTILDASNKAMNNLSPYNLDPEQEATINGFKSHIQAMATSEVTKTSVETQTMNAQYSGINTPSGAEVFCVVNNEKYSSLEEISNNMYHGIVTFTDDLNINVDNLNHLAKKHEAAHCMVAAEVNTLVNDMSERTGNNYENNQFTQTFINENIADSSALLMSLRDFGDTDVATVNQGLRNFGLAAYGDTVHYTNLTTEYAYEWGVDNLDRIQNMSDEELVEIASKKLVPESLPSPTTIKTLQDIAEKQQGQKRLNIDNLSDKEAMLVNMYAGSHTIDSIQNIVNDKDRSNPLTVSGHRLNDYQQMQQSGQDYAQQDAEVEVNLSFDKDDDMGR